MGRKYVRFFEKLLGGTKTKFRAASGILAPWRGQRRKPRNALPFRGHIRYSGELTPTGRPMVAAGDYSRTLVEARGLLTEEVRHDSHAQNLSGTRMEAASRRVHRVREYGASDCPRPARGVLDAGIGPVRPVSGQRLSRHRLLVAGVGEVANLRRERLNRL
jgi:hypothetical protein